MLNIKSQPVRSVARRQPFKILLIARPSTLIDLIELELTEMEYKVEVCHDFFSALLKHRQLRPQIIIIDSEISATATCDLCYRLRSQCNNTEILVLVAEQQILKQVAILNAGADDCVVTPFSMSEFIAKIQARLRRYSPKEPTVLLFDDLRLDTQTREVYRGDRFISLTTKEFELLKYLLLHPRQVLTRNQIIDHVWGYDFLGNSNVIEVYIRYLRLKLEADGSERLIHTVRGVGYVLRKSSLTW